MTIRCRWLLPLLLVAALPFGLRRVSAAAPAPVITETGTVMLPMRDGVKLSTNVFIPAGDGPFPVLLARTPYNKEGIRPPGGGALPMVVVVQDVRGRFASEGANIAFEPDGWGERRDGYDTCEWVLSQPWCNGKIGTYGGSALGITQILLAGAEAPGVVCQTIEVACGSLFHASYEGGAWRQALCEGWLRTAMWDPANLTLWHDHPTYDDEWAKVDGLAAAPRTTPAGLFTGGWYDIFSRGTVDIFLARQHNGAPAARGKQRLVMGPWPHGRNRRVGQLTFPENAGDLPAAFRNFAWEQYWLFGANNGVLDTPAVSYYLMGDVDDPDAPGNRWQTAETWPPPDTTPEPWRAAAGGDLVPGAADDVDLTFTYDPNHPVPTVGGRNLLLPAGPMDQREVEARDDVLVFTSDEREAPLAIAGDIIARLTVSSTAPDTDFTAKLCDVYPDGRSMLLVDGVRRMRFRDGQLREELMTPGERYEAMIDLGPVAVVIAPGHRLRLSISSSNSPKYQPNRNTGGPMFADEPGVPADNTVHRAELWLPVLELEGEGG